MLQLYHKVPLDPAAFKNKTLGLITLCICTCRTSFLQTYFLLKFLQMHRLYN